MQLDSITGDPWKLRIWFGADFDPITFQLVAEQLNGFVDETIQVNRRSDLRLLSETCSNPFDYRCCTMAIGYEMLQRGCGLAEIGFE